MKNLFVLLIFLFCFTLVRAQEQVAVSGKVEDINGEVLVGANVVVVGTDLGAATDENGKYKIIGLKPGKYQLKVLYIGYKEQVKEIEVLEGIPVSCNFVLEPSEIKGEEIVVIGYGVQKKRDVTGSITTVSVDEAKKIPTSNAVKALQGQAPGVNIEVYDGQPGTTPYVKIRGTGTINNNAPLYIIDGAPGDINFVNPEDIESIDILKDASAAAIYGSRAANGVIIVNTKRGTVGAPQISFKSSFGIQHLGKKMDLANAAEYIKIVKMANENAGTDMPKFVTEWEKNPSAFPDVDWQDEFFRDAPFNKYDLSISGGSKSFKYMISGMYAKQDGIAVATGSDKMTLRVNTDLTKGRFKFGQSLSLGRSRNEWNDNSGTEAIYQVLSMPPIVPVYDKNNIGGFGGPAANMDFPDPTNPVGYNKLTENKDDTYHVMATAYAEFEILKGLVYKTQLTANLDYYYSKFYQPIFQMGYVDKRDKALLSETRSRYTHTVMDHTLTFSKKYKKHDLTMLLGFSRERGFSRSTGGSVENFPSSDLKVLSAGTENANAFGTEYENRLQSFFGRASYSYANKYLFQFNIRRDGSSRFDKDTRYGTFPSISLGWRLSEESFFKSIPYSSFFNDVKIRGSWGKLGNQEIGNYAFIPTISVDATSLNYVFGINQDIYIGAAVTDFPALGIKWEETETKDIGFDFQMFEKQLEMTFDYYITTTTDMLVNVPIPISTGVWSGPVTNAGEMQNKGLEGSIIYHKFTGDFKYNISLNFSTYKNEIKKLGYADEVIWGGYVQHNENATTKSFVGSEIGAFYLYQTAGIFRSQEEINAYKNENGDLLQPNAKPGDVKFVDTNKDGVINDDDRVYMGSAIPDLEFGLNFNGTYKNFDFSILLHGVTGRKMYNGLRWLIENKNPSNNRNASKECLNGFSSEHSDSDFPRVVLGDPNFNGRPSDLYLEDGSYLRVKNIEIGYNFDSKTLKRFGIGGLRVYVSADNFLTFTDYTGYDPGVSGGSLFSRGVDRGLYPLAKTYLIGLQLKF